MKYFACALILLVSMPFLSSKEPEPVELIGRTFKRYTHLIDGHYLILKFIDETNCEVIPGSLSWGEGQVDTLQYALHGSEIELQPASKRNRYFKQKKLFVSSQLPNAYAQLPSRCFVEIAAKPKQLSSKPHLVIEEFRP